MNTSHIIHLWDIVKVVLKENLWINLEHMSQEKDEKINMIEMSTQGIIDQQIKPNYTEEIEKRKANIKKYITIKKTLKNTEDIIKTIF